MVNLTFFPHYPFNVNPMFVPLRGSDMDNIFVGLNNFPT